MCHPLSARSGEILAGVTRRRAEAQGLQDMEGVGLQASPPLSSVLSVSLLKLEFSLTPSYRAKGVEFGDPLPMPGDGRAPKSILSL